MGKNSPNQGERPIGGNVITLSESFSRGPRPANCLCVRSGIAAVTAARRLGGTPHIAATATARAGRVAWVSKAVMNSFCSAAISSRVMQSS
jgi:hypothetical protein